MPPDSEEKVTLGKFLFSNFYVKIFDYLKKIDFFTKILFIFSFIESFFFFNFHFILSHVNWNL